MIDERRLGWFALLGTWFVWFVLVGSWMIVCSSSGAQSAGNPADAVIAANIASRGGITRLKGVHAESMRGHISFGDGSMHPLSVDIARPQKIRTEITLAGGTLIQAYDGSVGWTVNPAGGEADRNPHLLPTGEALNVAAGADMDGAFVDYAAKGNRVTLAGIDTADGRPAYRLDIVTATGLNDSYYIDTVSHLQTKWMGHRVMNGTPVVFISFFRDYRPVDGIMIAFRIDSQTQGQEGGQRITMDTVRINPNVVDEEFAMPVAPPSKASLPSSETRMRPSRHSTP
ncbi:MAG: hypothetical protein ABI035_04750 [Gemmatimonadaceae bacterium]